MLPCPGAHSAIKTTKRARARAHTHTHAHIVFIKKKPALDGRRYRHTNTVLPSSGNVLFNDALNTFFNLWIYGVRHMVKDQTDSEREETRCRHIAYSFRLAARVILYASSHRQDNTYHGLGYTSRGALAGTRNVSMGPPGRIDPTIHRTISERSYHGATHHF